MTGGSIPAGIQSSPNQLSTRLRKMAAPSAQRKRGQRMQHSCPTGCRGGQHRTQQAHEPDFGRGITLRTVLAGPPAWIHSHWLHSHSLHM